jgi:hypothetical protein
MRELPRKICSLDLPSLAVPTPTPPAPRHLYSLKPVYRVYEQLSSRPLFHYHYFHVQFHVHHEKEVGTLARCATDF